MTPMATSNGASATLTPITPPKTLVWQSMHDLGLATWFGSSLWNAVATPLPHGEAPIETSPLAASVVEAEERHRFRPVEYGAVALTLVSGLALGVATRGRRHPMTAAAHLLLTGAAVGAAVWSEGIKRKLDDAERMAAQMDAAPLSVVPEEPAASWPGDGEEMAWTASDEFSMKDAMPTPLDEAIKLERMARMSAWTAAGITGALVVLDAMSHARARKVAASTVTVRAIA